MDDTDLVAAMARKDPAGLDGAYRRYADRLFAYACTVVGDRHAAADVVHDTFVLASQHVMQLRDPSRLPQWLYSIARHEGLRQLRQQARHRPLEAAPEIATDTADLSRSVQSAQVAEVVQAAIAGLSNADHEIAELAVRHQLSAAEIASVLGVPLNNAHARLSRAREQLAIALGAILVARHDDGSCQDLSAILTGWGGRLNPLLRKRLHRHIESCQDCSRVQAERLNPAALLSSYAALPFLAAPEAANPLGGLAPAPDSGQILSLDLGLPGGGPSAGPGGGPSAGPAGGPTSGIHEGPSLAPGGGPGGGGKPTHAHDGSQPGLASGGGTPRPPHWDKVTGFPTQPRPKRNLAPAIAVTLLILALIGGGGAAMLNATKPAGMTPLTSAPPTETPTPGPITSPSAVVTTPPIVTTPPESPSGPPPLSFTANVVATCVSGDAYTLMVTVTANSNLDTAKFRWSISGSGVPIEHPMNVSGKNATLGPITGVSLEDEIPWRISIEDTGGRTKTGPNRETDHPC